MDRGERGVVMGLIRLLPRSGAAQPAVEPVDDATPEMPLEEALVEPPGKAGHAVRPERRRPHQVDDGLPGDERAAVSWWGGHAGDVLLA